MKSAKPQKLTAPGLLACVFLLTLAAPLFAGDAGSSAGSFLKFAPSPRGTGMGEAYTAVTEDAYASWWNPAALAALEQPELGATYNASMESVSHQYVSFAYPVRYGATLGLNVTRLSVAPFTGYDAAGYKTRDVDAADTAIAGSYARTLLKDEIERPVFSVGGNLKSVSSRLDNVTASAFALDLGALYYLRPSNYWMKGVPAQEFRFGLSLKNVGTGLKYDKIAFPLPMSATLGAAWISHPWGAHTLTLALDQTVSNDDKYTISAGGEYTMFQILSFRAGYKTGQDIGSGIRFGVGFKLSFIDIDYSMSPYGDLGAMNKIGLSMRFGVPRGSQPLQGKTARVSGGKMMAPKAKIQKLEGFASDYVELAKKDLSASRYVSAQDNFARAFNLEPGLKDGAWGAKAKRLGEISQRLRLRENPARGRTLRNDNEQGRISHEAVMAYVNAHDLKAFLLAHVALGTDIHGNSVFEELLHVLAELTRNNVRPDEILPRPALVKEKLKKAARFFYIQQFDMAGKECEEVTLIDEANPLGWTRLGSAYYMMGDKEKARKAYQTALELRPDDQVILKFMEAQGWK